MPFFHSQELNHLKAIYSALSKAMAVIQFKPDGTIITANDNFLSALGYSLDEVIGKNHSMFVDPAYANSHDYKQFWQDLRAGQFQAREFRRVRKDGSDVWIEASYNPLVDAKGNVYEVVKYATDITAKKLLQADYAGQLEAISKAMAVIEFNLDGTIITANENFLAALDYKLEEVRGKHHSMFVDPDYGRSDAYRDFWAQLRAGKYQADQFKRSAKTGKAVWIQACYNPIFDMNGKPFKVVKYATDITAQIAFMDDVRRLIGQMDDAIKNANQQAAGAAVAATETSQTVQTVASGAEEMSASVAEISQSMANSLEAVIVAKSQTENADMSAQKLTQAAKAMEGIVQLIQNIAGQINLLALNATIEAARAGEAGKGFAVVADEVKMLAKQASDATEQINTEIAATQSIAREVVGALGEIRNKVDGVQQYVSGTASAVEEQNAVTREISSNMQQASLAVEDINQSVSKIASAIHAASASVAATQAAANAMRR